MSNEPDVINALGSLDRRRGVILGIAVNGQYYACVPLRNKPHEIFGDAWRRPKAQLAPKKRSSR